MSFGYIDLKPEMVHCLAICKVTNQHAIDEAIASIMKGGLLDSYREAGRLSGVPAAWIAAVDYREDDNNPLKALGQGDPWNRVSTHEPRGKGPFRSKADAAQFYLRYDHVNVLPPPEGHWTMPYSAYWAERWNGFGPRNHGRHSGYPWGGTNIYNGGMYVEDGKWSSSATDKRAGVVPIMLQLGEMFPDLKVPDVMPVGPVPDEPPAPMPMLENTAEVQKALNYLGYQPTLFVDNSFGRQTARNLRRFQQAKGLTVDGIPGQKTKEALQQAVNNRKMSKKRK